MKPYHAGRKAFRNPHFYRGPNGNLLQEANPYEKGTKDHKDWEFGFNKEYYENLGAGSQGVPQKEKSSR